MGCVSSKLLRKNLKQEFLYGNGDYTNHVVSLTSSTYGVLKLEKNGSQPNDQKQQEDADMKVVCVKGMKRSPPWEEPEVIDAWELMGDLEEGMPISIKAKKSPKSLAFFRGNAENGVRRSPLRYLNQIESPKRLKNAGGKENKEGNVGVDGKVKHLGEFTPKRVLKSWKSLDSPRKLLSSTRCSRKSSPLDSKFVDSPRNSSGCSLRRRSLTPLFDPELIETFEKELSEEQEEIKQIVSQTPKMRSLRKSRDSNSILETFKLKCPPGGENAVVIYTTTLRGIRKTFEDCNTVRSITESHQIHTLERDVSMHSGFKEELRKLMGTKEVKVPAVFVKGRLIGGAEELVKLEEEGKLEILFDGIPRAFGSICKGCAGIRFVMCMKCNGSCKILNEEEKNMVRCGECNENGLIQCPVCC
ncbi:hypothetical protein Ancab_014305 [Ancistrocladus abbreviatus]